MSYPEVAMLGTAVVGGVAAILVVTGRNVVHAAVALVVALIAVAGTFLLIGAEFLAWAQVLIYVGAVVVLILFGLMLTRAPIGRMVVRSENRGMALVVSVALFVFLTVMIFQSFGDVRLEPTHTTTGMLADVLYTYWAFPFMVLGFFLTVALIGAVVIARQEVGEGPEPPRPEGAPEAARPEPAPTDASSSPGVTEASEEVST